MGLKYYNSNGEIVLTSKLNLVKFFLKIVKIKLKIALKNESYKLFDQENVLIA